MNLEFKQLQNAVAKQFKAMATGPLFQVAIDKDRLWETYLGAFPPGTNPIYKTRTEHDCSCCKHFIRTLGGVVSIVGDELATIWDGDIDGPYAVVTATMADFVGKHTIDNEFRHPLSFVGQANSRQLLEDKSVHTWDHFHVNLPQAVVTRGELIGPALSNSRATHDVLLRGLDTITLDAIDTVLELVAQNSLYRGEENRFAVESFRKLKVAWGRTSKPDLYVWSMLNMPESVTRIRNTAIGTLLTDLSEGQDLEAAVGSFEAKVAPQNYKRPTALVSKAMVKQAQEKVNELGFSTALERRYATADDLTVGNVLFVDRSSRKLDSDVFDSIASGVTEKAGKNLNKVEEVGISDFIEKVLPKADTLEVLFENRHTSNLVSLIAPCDPTAKGLFKWPNNFSWSYAGDMADSIKERVKRAGGTVTGDLCCRLAWDYADDLDFHMYEPHGGHISYMNRRLLSPYGGMLDLDANGCDGIRPDPAENIFYADRRKMVAGTYALSVNNYCRRSAGAGFEVEIEFDGQTHSIVYDKAMHTGETISVAKVQYRAGQFSIVDSLPSTQTSKSIWGMATQTYRKVNMLMLSPNYWDERAVGNKHYFFMLEGCCNDGKARGFYNEFLVESLSPHRKVFEIVGSKMRTDESDRQLSGVGFSSTQRNSILCHVSGSFTRTVKVVF